MESFYSLSRLNRSAAAAPGLLKCTDTPFKLRKSSQRWAAAAFGSRTCDSTAEKKLVLKRATHLRGLRTPPPRARTSLGAPQNRRKTTHPTEHPQLPQDAAQTPGPPIQAPTPLLEGPIKTKKRGVRRPTVQSCTGSRACGSANQQANRQPRHQEAAPNTPSDGRRRAHGGPEPASTEHDARAS